MKTNIDGTVVRDDDQLDQFMPLLVVKRRLLEQLGIDDNHFYQIFVTYRFKHSLRKQ